MPGNTIGTARMTKPSCYGQGAGNVSPNCLRPTKAQSSPPMLKKAVFKADLFDGIIGEGCTKASSNALQRMLTPHQDRPTPAEYTGSNPRLPVAAENCNIA